MKTFAETVKDILVYIGITLIFLCSCIVDSGATAFKEDSVDALTSGYFYGTAKDMDEVGVYSDYVIWYPDSGELEMDGKSIYSFKGMIVECDLGEVRCDGKTMYIHVYLGDRELDYIARKETENDHVRYIFDMDDIREIECDIAEKIGFPLN